ncbi:hypothetical protein AQUCO_00201166v1 [Aquilegia coerulea]|uniref:F-box domain-containing protein n=1 Tax=Aquilegia coerulea TaxID=218851 RepID=A0A2G5F6J1_AQUCA|nr:hypothetical protein AQUCO_00201166v1 [Aquilegia coerulea]
MSTNLPNEIIFEILSRLPAKSLLQFRCVSKLWCNEISEFDFIKMHLNQSIERDNCNLFLASTPNVRLDNLLRMPLFLHIETNLYCIQGNVFTEAIKFQDISSFGFPLLKLVGSCQGLVCLIGRKELYFLNPSTREYKMVQFDKVFDIGSSNAYGFSYDLVNDDYLFVQIVYKNEDKANEFGDYDIEINTYSISGHSGFMTGDIPRILNRKDPAVFLNGGLHWITDTVSRKIIALDIGEKVVREFLRPMEVDLNDHISVGVLGGQLCMMNNFYDSDVKIWIMKNYGVSDSWSKLYVMGNTVLDARESLHKSRPLCFARNGEILFKCDTKLVLYDPKRKMSTNLEIHGISDWGDIDNIVKHDDSLVGLKSGTFLVPIPDVEEGGANIKERFDSTQVEVHADQ